MSVSASQKLNISDKRERIQFLHQYKGLEIIELFVTTIETITHELNLYKTLFYNQLLFYKTVL